MRINEFRLLLNRSSAEDVLKVAAEIYKCIPKAMKEDPFDGVDVKIRQILDHQDLKKDPKKDTKTVNIDYDSLHDEIAVFIKNAYDYNYFRPNRIISKPQRSKWRFLVMRFVKALQSIPSDDENHYNSIVDLLDIYKMLSYGCAFYIFRSDDVFASISKKQYEFYDMICAKAFDNGFNAEILPQLIEACTVTELDRSTLYITLIKILLGYIVEKNEILSTIEAAEKVKNKVAELIKGGRPREAILGEATITYHTRVRGIENLAALIMVLQFKLSEYDKGCEYYWDTCEKFDINTRKNEDGKSKDMEIVFYCLLDHLYYLTKDNNLWIEFYEKYVSYVTPRDSLVEKYNALKNATT